MNEFEKRAFSAGITEGEGGFYLTKSNSLQPSIRITNACIPLLGFCKSVIGGKVYPHKRKVEATYPIRKKRFALIITGQRAVLSAIKKLAPYLVTLKGDAALLAEFCERRLNNERRNSPYTKRDWEIYRKLKKRD